MHLLERIKNKLKRSLSKRQRKKLHSFIINNRLIGLFIKNLFGRNLTRLAIVYDTDKWGYHQYTKHYESHLKIFRNKKIKLLEIGVGGYDSPDEGGNSLRMWKRYFPHGQIYSIDIHDKSQLEEDRIKIFRGSQNDLLFLQKVIDEIGDSLDIIIDDGSHINEHVISSFKFLFPKLKGGGVYIIEDTETSYKEKYGGGSENLNNPNTTMNFFKRIPDYINNEKLIKNKEGINYFQAIESINFYHNLIIIFKSEK